MGIIKIKYISYVLIVIFLSGCAEEHSAYKQPPPAPEMAIYYSGKIYTADPNAPWAEAIVTRGEKIIFVGSDEGASRYADENTLVVDLAGRMVLPGLIDSHTHPGLVAILSDDNAKLGALMPSKPKRAILDWLHQYTDENWWELFITQGYWDVAEFLPQGPNKADLDEVSWLKPILLFDNSGHSYWVNSAMLRLLGVDENTPDLSEVSYFVRDEEGQLTGWIKEFALFPYIGDMMLPSKEVLRRRFKEQVDHLASMGVTTLWDAGNFLWDDAVYEVASELDREGLLPVRYEGSYHIWDPAQIDIAKDKLLELRTKYSGTKLQFNTIKIHFDGVHEILTAGELEPYATEPDNYGGVLFTTWRLSEFMLELEESDINLHLHTVGSRAVRTALDALELAIETSGDKLETQLTLSHLEYVHPDDIARFKELNVHANFTPHWFGGGAFGEAGELNLGKDRASQSQVVGDFVRAGANVTLSSDVISGEEAHRANPFIGLEMSITRQEYGKNETASILSPASAAITLETAIRAYTANGARQLDKENKLGTLAAGKMADFIVLDKNLFNIETTMIHQTKPLATFIGGQLIHGAL